MPLAKRLLPILLALLWAPLAVHCELEALTGWDILHCDAVSDTPGPNSHCGDDACNEVESGLYHLPAMQALIAPSLFVVVSLVALHEIISPPIFPTIAAPVQTSPPDTPRPWQFLIRAALPVRAPSLPA